MPYRSTKDVPKQKNTQTEAEKKAFRSAFNNAKERGLSEEEAFQRGNAAANRVKRSKH